MVLTPEAGTPKRQDSLRDRAEAILGHAKQRQAVQVDDIKALVHEFQVHQIELEMQNEELQSAQNALQVSHDHITDLYDNAPVAYLTLDRDGVVHNANLTAAALLKMARGQLIGARITDFIPRDSQDDFYLHRQAVFSGFAKQGRELRLRRTDGETLVVWMESISSRAEGGKASRQCRTAILDITARRRAEDELRRLNEELERRVAERTAELAGANRTLARREYEFRTLATSVPALFSYVNAGERYVFVNQHYELLFERPAAAIVGRTVRELLGEAAYEHERGYIAQVLRGGRAAYEMEVDFGGRRRVLDVVQVPDFDEQGRVKGYFTLKNDVTARKRAEERLRLLWTAAAILSAGEQADELRDLFAQIGRHLGATAQFLFIAHESDNTLAPRSCEGIAVETATAIQRREIAAATAGHGRHSPRPVMRSDLASATEERWTLTDDSRIRAYVCCPLVADGKLLGTLFFASSTREWFESDELEFLRTIASHVAAALVRARLVERLHEVDLRKDEFLAALAREFQIHLEALRNARDLLRLDAGNSPAIEQSQPMIERQIARIARLVDDLFDLAKISRGELTLSVQQIDLVDAIQIAVEASLPAVEAAGRQLTIALASEPLPVRADPARLAQVVAILLDNAVKFTDNGGQIELSIERRTADMLLKIADNGIGIARDMIPGVFDLFAQADRYLERSRGGLGIGLTLAKQLVDLHGGAIEARSEGPGHGSEFTIRLPRVVPAATKTDRAPKTS